MILPDGQTHSKALHLLVQILHCADPAQRGALAETLRSLLAAPMTPRSAPVSPGQHKVPITDAGLDYVNAALPWSSFFMDDLGRAVGNRYTESKRNNPDSLRDARITRLADAAPGATSVVEYGCFEGNHTAELCQRYASVIAIDGRIENCLKTLVRCWLVGHRPDVRLLDFEDVAAPLPEADIAHHVGVLYHLTNPVAHLRQVLQRTRRAVLLDSQVATPGKTNTTTMIDGVAIPVFRYGEKDTGFAPFAGLAPHALWLTDETITGIARAAGFAPAAHELRDERNGLRLMTILVRG